MLALPLLLLLGAAAAATQRAPPLEAVGWWVGDGEGGQASMNRLEQFFDLDLYTIIRPQSGIVVAENGSCSCDPTPFQAKLVAMAHQRGVKVQGSPSFNVTRGLPKGVGGGAGDEKYRAEYLRTVGAAVAACDLDGLEFDYEPLNDMLRITPEHATAFTVLMAEIKAAMGPGKLMSEDVGVWGLSQGSYPLKVDPWVNVSMLNAGAIDFINTMSYHTPRDGSIAQWRQDMAWFDKHGFDRSRVNIGLPYYTFNYTDNAASPTHPGEKVVNEPTWGE